MEITFILNMMLIPVEYVGWDADHFNGSIDQLCTIDGRI
jgi:hypothetical protein